MRYLAIDYGRKRTGVAICDPDETIASPLGVLESGKRLPQKIAELVEKHEVGAIVVGLPLNMDDSEGPQAKCVRRFVQKLQKHITVPVHLHDERLSSFSATVKLGQASLRPPEIRRRLDAVAAAEILQSFLEQKRKV